MKKGDHLYQQYLNILREELRPAMGCTEPIALAYAAAKATQVLGGEADRIELFVSGNIIKNVKSVIVPATGGLHGIEAAAAVGIIAGDPEKELLVISQVSKEQQEKVAQYLKKAKFNLRESKSGSVFDISITLSAAGHQAACRIAEDHTNIVLIQRDGETVYSRNIKKSSARRQLKNCTTKNPDFLKIRMTKISFPFTHKYG